MNGRLLGRLLNEIERANQKLDALHERLDEIALQVDEMESKLTSLHERWTLPSILAPSPDSDETPTHNR